MRIFMVTLGSRGDVEPFIALGQGLQARGHAVTLCTSDRFRPIIEAYGLNYGYMSNDWMKLVDSDTGREAIERSQNLWQWLKTARQLTQQMGPVQRQMMQDGWAAAEAAQPDMILFHPKAFGGPTYAEILGVPVMMAVPLPSLVPTGEFPSLVLPSLPLGSIYNRFTYRIVKVLTQWQVGSYIKDWRKQHQLPPQPKAIDILHRPTGEPLSVLHAYSPSVVPEPDDWPESVHATGYWFLDEPPGWRPPSDLQAFLDAGDPPVYVGFGSMAGRNPQRITRVILDALQQSGVRGILATGWGGLQADRLPDSIFKLEAAPHRWLFPRMAAVVHHGGAGTTAAGLRAGKPTIICPFFGDQPFWGDRVADLGVGPEPIPQSQLTAERLAAAIRQVTTDELMQQRAKGLGETIRAERGVERAAELIEAELR